MVWYRRRRGWDLDEPAPDSELEKVRSESRKAEAAGRPSDGLDRPTEQTI
jgi:hypothetical protein